MPSFAAKIIRWQRRHGRHDLPWQVSRDPYRIWLSEVMLQQTQVGTVIPYYERFLAQFPDVRALAAAPLEDVLALWSGLGYYARARNLHRAARVVVELHGASFPSRAQALAALPGLGRSSAAAIAVFAFGERAAILDGNVKRVLARAFGIDGYPGEGAVQEALWQLAESLLPRSDVPAYTQGLMDLGATVCTRTRPTCTDCPVATDCVARREDRIAALPGARPKRDTPQRQATWLVLRHAGRVLLEQRPATGLWGGLWVFPQTSDTKSARSHARELGCEIGAVRKLAPLEHAFTHFRLTVRPLLCEATRIQPAVRQDARRWLTPDEARRAAIPVPVRTLLARLDDA